MKIRKTKKKFYPVIAPMLFNEQELGEIPLYDLREAVGRTLNANLMTLTNNPKQQNINLHFRIISTDGQKALTEITGFNIIPSSIRRMIKRKKIRIDDSFVVKTDDNISVRIKPLLITRGFARSSAKKGLNKMLRDTLKKNISKINYETLLKEIISHRLQRDLKEKLKKTYPLIICEIRAMEIEKEKKEVKEEKEKVIKEEKVEERTKEERKEKEVNEEKEIKKKEEESKESPKKVKEKEK